MHRNITQQDIHSVLRAIHEEVLQSEDGAHDLARAIGRPYSTMMRELNPNDDKAKLGVAEWLAILDATRKFGSLHKIAGLFGLRLVPAAPASEA